jgi:hypothetical protein
VLGSDRAHSFLPSQVVKAPHHGSEGALDWSVLDALTAHRSDVLVAPYRPSRIPRDDQLALLEERLGRVWTAAPSVKPAEHAISEILQLNGSTVVRYRVSGALQARRRGDEGAWRVNCRAPGALWGTETGAGSG